MSNFLFSLNLITLFLVVTGTYLLLLQAFERNSTFKKHRLTLLGSTFLAVVTILSGVYSTLIIGTKVTLVLGLEVGTIVILLLLFITAMRQATINEIGQKVLTKSHGLIILSLSGFIFSMAALTLLFSAISTS